jgi:hypothetical protein
VCKHSFRHIRDGNRQSWSYAYDPGSFSLNELVGKRDYHEGDDKGI